MIAKIPIFKEPEVPNCADPMDILCLTIHSIWHYVTFGVRTIAPEKNCPKDNCPPGRFPPLDICPRRKLPPGQLPPRKTAPLRRGKLPLGKLPPHHKISLENN